MEAAARKMPNRRRRPTMSVDVESMDALYERMELSRDIAISRREFAEGKGIPQDVVFSRLHEKLLAMKANERKAALA